MRKIYLATQSKPRRKLFRIFGLAFKTLVSCTKEKGFTKRMSYAGIARHNALLKAESAAKRVKSGIIIAADTIVVQDGRVSGKPKNLADAKRMLKRLAKKPQWIYSGLAVIDKDNKKILSDYEKTKIYMDKLSDKEIDAYFRNVSPMDKAGSFDIQGKGAFFIRRIEGCFYNVVGLPLNKLYRMLKKLDVKVFAFLFCIVNLAAYMLLSGCSIEYNIVTGEEEKHYYSADKEAAMGQSIAKEVINEYGLADDPLVQKRVEDIGKKISAICDRKEISCHFYVLKNNEVNAFSLPGRYVFINRGLIDKVVNDNELAGVIGHEVGHIVARHSIKRLQGEQLYSV